MKRKNKNNELVKPKKPAKPKAPTKPEQTKKEYFEFCALGHFCSCEDDEADLGPDKNCFVCKEGLQDICNKTQISFADLLKIRARLNLPDEEILVSLENNFGDICAILSYSKDIENPDFHDEMLKYEKDIANFDLKIKEYEHKLQEYMRLKEEFIRNRAEQEINRLSKILKG